MKTPSSNAGATIAISQSVVVGVASTVVLFVVVLKLVLPFVQKYRKNKKLAKLVGQTKGYWLWGDMSKNNFSNYEGLQNAVQHCEEHLAMCSQWIGPFHFNIALYHPDVTKTLLSKSSLFVYCHIMVFNKNCQTLLDRCESGAESGTNMDVIVEIFDITFTNTMKCVLSQTADQDGVGLTDNEIIDEVITFFMGGQDTVANGVSWTFYNLANNPGHQQKCRDEIEEVIGFKDEVDMNDMNKLVYLTQCIKESLRWIPIIHLISRELTEDVTFSHRFNDHKEVTVPAGNFASVNIYALHRNPHVWQNPNVFNPDNFNEENVAKRSSFAFLPFAAGPRNYIGQHFAMHQMRVVLCQLLRIYEFYRDPDTQEPQIVPGVALQSRNGIQLKVKHT